METERAHTCVSHGTCPISKMYASLSVLGTMARGTEMLCCSSLLPSILQQQRLLRCYACCMLGISPPLVDDVVTIAVRQQCTSSLPARHVALVPSHVIIPIAQKTLFDGKDPASVLQCVFPCTQNVRIPFVPFLFVLGIVLVLAEGQMLCAWLTYGAAPQTMATSAWTPLDPFRTLNLLGNFEKKSRIARKAVAVIGLFT
mmetsp:Transcript_38955/g.123880  ORF Transcript_38955/g.123880 Transcript_38955/m.123880 type:complete len:200 (+) Transcript_38955:1395-1994(+)